jgi:hypothetical protein
MATDLRVVSYSWVRPFATVRATPSPPKALLSRPTSGRRQAVAVAYQVSISTTLAVGFLASLSSSSRRRGSLRLK